MTASSTSGELQQRAAERLQALGLDAVVVGHEHPHVASTRIVAGADCSAPV